MLSQEADALFAREGLALQPQLLEEIVLRAHDVEGLQAELGQERVQF